MGLGDHLSSVSNKSIFRVPTKALIFISGDCNGKLLIFFLKYVFMISYTASFSVPVALIFLFGL